MLISFLFLLISQAMIVLTVAAWYIFSNVTLQVKIGTPQILHKDFAQLNTYTHGNIKAFSNQILFCVWCEYAIGVFKNICSVTFIHKYGVIRSRNGCPVQYLKHGMLTDYIGKS